ncbi:MAG: metallophosphoesterase family protein [Synergistaceae bacterium]|nr:metallophosphoesterase family protein [Synergistaceae bacterium]
MIYFTADLHLDHENIIRHCKRPFSGVAEMNRALIDNWNATVTAWDEIYILGDLTMRPAPVAHGYLSRMCGKKYFIRGNHDKFLNDFEPYERDFIWVKDYFVLKHSGRKFVLFHYPIAEWDGYFRGAVHLYGHIHNSRTSGERANAAGGLAFNVGVDVNGFRPVSIDAIMSMAEAREQQ